MDIFKLPPIHKACGSDDLRPVMSYILIDEGYAIATDAHILVALDLFETCLEKKTIEALNQKLIPKEFWKLMSKTMLVPQGIEVEEKQMSFINKQGFRITCPFGTDNYPNYKAILVKDKGSVERIGLNPILLMSVFECLGKPINLRLHFLSESKAIMVYPNTGSNSYALIMPVMIS